MILSIIESERSESKKINTAKVINFSFYSQSPRGKSKESCQTRRNFPSKLNFVELVAGKWAEERLKNKRDSSSKNKVVVDLSGPHFRKTFTYNLRERREEVERLQEGQGQYMLTKRGDSTISNTGDCCWRTTRWRCLPFEFLVLLH
jgi:hypothetical protein